MTRVLLISEKVLFRHALARVLTEEQSLVSVDEAAYADKCFKQIATTEPDIILLHVANPITAGMQTLREIEEKLPSIPVLVLLDDVDDTAMKVAIQSGAAGCLDASVDTGRLLQAIEDAANGEMALSEGLARRLVRMLAAGNGKRNGEPFLEMPTNRELEVLKLLSLGLTNATIARKLFISESTVRAHVRTITQKLGAHNRLHAVARALELGMISTASDH